MVSLVQVSWLAAFGFAAYAGRRVWRSRPDISGRDLCLIVLLGLVMVPWCSTSQFHGLEYEDAFEYESAGALLSSHSHLSDSSLNPICLDGSLVACAVSGGLSHPIGYSAFLAAIYSLVGFSTETASMVAGFFHVMSTVLVFLLSLAIQASARGAWLSVVGWLSAPCLLVLSMTGFSEPASSFLVLTVLLLFAVWDGNGRRDDLLLFGLFVVLTLSVSVRRDNLMLLGVLPVAAVVKGMRTGESWRTSVSISAICSAVVAFFGVGARSALTIPGDLSQNADWFSIERWPVMIPALFAEWADPRSLGILIPGAVLGLYTLRRNVAAGALILTVWTYVVVFVSFGQSHEFIRTGRVNPVHLQRYSYEISGALAVLFGSGVLPFFRSKRSSLRLSASVAAIALTLAAMTAHSQRQRGASIEHLARISPVKKACLAVEPDAVLVTTEILIPQLWCPGAHVMAYGALADSRMLERLDKHIVERPVYYLQLRATDGVGIKKWHAQRTAVESRFGSESIKLDVPGAVLRRLVLSTGP